MVSRLTSVTMLYMVTLDPDDTRPPYVQVVAALRQEIEQGVLQPGAKLPTQRQLVSRYGVSTGTIKRALGELQGAGLIVSRQGQGAFVRTRRSVLESVPHNFSADILGGLWVTCYKFHIDDRVDTHADITRVVPQSHRRLTATNYSPEPRNQNYVLTFRNEIEALLANRHLIGHWKNVSDTRYFGSIHLAILPGESVMEGYYTSFLDDIKVDAMPWKWVRLDSASLVGIKLPALTLKEPDVIHGLLTQSADNSTLPISAVTEGGD
jgi:DNA-binding transcriptional regulator YhcF (GntR family)